MGLQIVHDDGRWPCYDMEGKSVVDLGGGPVSILLKCRNVKGTVVDPCDYPVWIRVRYAAAEIRYIKQSAEACTTGEYDECWIYNVLQHVCEPERIIENARHIASVIRIFEWIDFPPSLGHPHTLREAELNEWLDGRGTIERMNENGCHGRAYYGTFYQ